MFLVDVIEDRVNLLFSGSQVMVRFFHCNRIRIVVRRGREERAEIERERRGKRNESKLTREVARRIEGKEEERGVERGRGQQMCEEGGLGVVRSFQGLRSL